MYISPIEITGMPHKSCKPHVRDIVLWAIKKGRAAIFANYGLHKTVIQLEIARLITEATGGNFLIIAPLGVRQEFKRDAFDRLEGLPIEFIRSTDEVKQVPLIHKTKANIFLTNYRRNLWIVSATGPRRHGQSCSPAAGRSGAGRAKGALPRRGNE